MFNSKRIKALEGQIVTSRGITEVQASEISRLSKKIDTLTEAVKALSDTLTKPLPPVVHKDDETEYEEEQRTAFERFRR